MTFEKLWFSNTTRKTWSTVGTEPPEEGVECPPQPGKRPMPAMNARQTEMRLGNSFKDEFKGTYSVGCNSSIDRYVLSGATTTPWQAARK
jgi:hypothetical protein